MLKTEVTVLVHGQSRYSGHPVRKRAIDLNDRFRGKMDYVFDLMRLGTMDPRQAADHQDDRRRRPPEPERLSRRRSPRIEQESVGINTG